VPNGFDFGDWTSFFGSLLSGLYNVIVQVFTFLWNFIVVIFEYLWSALVIVARFLLQMLGTVGKFFRNLWENVIKRGLVKLVELYGRLRQILEKYLGPVLRVLRRIRQLIDYWYFRIFGPILQLIQRLRQVLMVFRIFGIKLARRLDERLMFLESRIAGVYLVVRGTLNQIATTINLVLDPELLIRRGVLGSSLLKYVGAVKRVVGFGHSRPLTIEEEDSQAFERGRFKPDAALANNRRRAESGPLPEDVKMQEALRREFAAVTGIEVKP
jgi:hypothetical protein